MTLPTILDRVERPKQIKPGSYKAACPCCHSRKGRPLYITEAGDRVLLHAFCGCDTEAVLHALGLTVTDLFSAPISPRLEPSEPRFPARDLMQVLAQEINFVALLGADFLENRAISEDDWQRLARAVSRINTARDHIG